MKYTWTIGLTHERNFHLLQFKYFLKDPVKYDVKYQVQIISFSVINSHDS